MKHKVFAASWAAVAAMIITVIVVIVSEYSAAFKGALASVTGHHWVTKSLLAAILFVVFFVILGAMGKKGKKETAAGLWPVVVTGAASIVILFGFYLIHYLSG